MCVCVCMYSITRWCDIPLSLSVMASTQTHAHRHVCHVHENGRVRMLLVAPRACATLIQVKSAIVFQGSPDKTVAHPKFMGCVFGTHL